MALFDTHAHLDDDRFDPDRDAVIQRAAAAGVETILSVGTTAQTSAKAIELAARYPGVYAAVGIHPNDASQAAPGDWDRIVELASAPKVVALGETGLDRHWDHTPFELQQDYFDRHIRLSQERALPFVVHVRDCQDDALVMLRAAVARGRLAGVMHSFTGTADAAAECVAMGLFISFAGMLTYKKSVELRAVAATVPADRLLVETDSPYLSPEPLRGRRNEPAHVVHTAARLAEVRGISPEELADLTTANARTLFRLGIRPA